MAQLSDEGDEVKLQRLTVPLAPKEADDSFPDVEDRMQLMERRDKWLRHQFEVSIQQQAHAFRSGLVAVTGRELLDTLEAHEIARLLGRSEVNDADLARWQSRTRIDQSVRLQAQMFQTWLSKCDAAKRSTVLKFATGRVQVPPNSEERWQFFISEPYGSRRRIDPTSDNGLTAAVYLATAATCGWRIMLPKEWKTLQDVEVGMEQTLLWGQNGFGEA